MSFALQVPIQVPFKLTDIVKPMRFKILHGGRGGGKSHTIAQVLIAMSLQRRLRILCVREVQKSVRESSMQVLIDYIRRLNLERYFEILDKEIRCRTTGSRFSFSGLKDHTADSIKSFEGADIVWVEEAHSVTANSWNILIPTILRTAGAEIWASFNPNDDQDYVYDRFVKNVDPNAWVVEINWRDNPWFNAAMNEERLQMKAVNDDLYQHIWEGKCRTVAGLLFKRKWFKFYLPADLPKELRIYGASDYAVTDDGGDWTEHGRAGLDTGGNLYFTEWWSGQTDPEVWIKALVGIMGKLPRPLMWFREKGVILRASSGAITKRLRELQTHVFQYDLPSAGNKSDRALGFAARCAAGTVYLPLNEDGTKPDWVERLVNQLCSFTGEQKNTDDMVDVCSLLARGLDVMSNAQPEASDDREPIKPFTRRHIEGLDRESAYEERQKDAYYT